MPKLFAFMAAVGVTALVGGALAQPPPLPDPASIPAVEALVSVRDYGDFRLRFHREAAPNHVAHFLTLAANGAFDGMSFHRVIPRFIIQIGDPNSRDEDLQNDGPGGPDYRLPPEPNDLTHRRGTVSMAWRGDDPASAGSQWFVCLEDLPSLDGRATVFAEVSSGMETVDRIAQVSTRRNRNPRRRVVVERVELVAPAESAPGTDEAPSLEQGDGATVEKDAADGERDAEDQAGLPR